MTQTRAYPRRPTPVTGFFDDVYDATAAAGGGEALAMAFDGPNGEWSYSATAEGRTGEVAGDYGIDLDGEPGLVYDGPAGAAVRVHITDLDIGGLGINSVTEGNITVTVGLFKNNDLVGHADEGWTAAPTLGAAEFNLNAVVDNLYPNDVLRTVMLVSSGSDAGFEFKVASGGQINLE